jgi:hypothetical protein
MATERQIEANRRNAQLSTGPRTPGGKARVALNALQHGLTGKQVVLPNENSDEFDAFRSALRNDLCPQGSIEEVLADKVVADAWRLRRVPVLEAEAHQHCWPPLEGSDRTFAILSRHEEALTRSLLRTLHELERLQARRAGEHIPAPVVVDVDVSVPEPPSA